MTAKPQSRQAKYQQRHKLLGLCKLCNEKAVKCGLCAKHYEAHLKYNREAARKRLEKLKVEQ